MEKIYAPIDNKNLMEDGFEDDIFQDFYHATDHRQHNNVRHLVGIVKLGDDCDAYVDVHWHFGDAAITITMLAANPFYGNMDEQRDVLWRHYEDVFRDMERGCNENCFPDETFHVGLKRDDYKLEVSFWWEVE